MRKNKKILLMILSFLCLALVVIGVFTTKALLEYQPTESSSEVIPEHLGAPVDTNQNATGKLHIMYKAYNADDYDAYAKKLSNWKVAFSSFCDNLWTPGRIPVWAPGDNAEFAKDSWAGTLTGKYAELNILIDGQSALDYFGGYPDNMLGVTLTNSLPQSFADNAYPVTITPSTEFAKGDTIVIEVLVKYIDEPLRTVAVEMDINDLDMNSQAGCNGNSHGVADSAENSYSGNYNGTGRKSAVVGCNMTTVGATFDATDWVVIGTITSGTTTSPNSVTIKTPEITAANGTSLTTSSGTRYNVSANNTRFAETPLVLSLGSASSNTTISTPTVNDTATTPSGSPILGKNTYDATSAASTASSVTAHIEGLTGSKIMKVIAGSTPANIITDLNGSATGIAGLNGDYTIPLGNPGTTTYVGILCEAQDGSGSEIHFITIPKDKNNSNQLSGLTVTPNGSSVTTSVALSPNFNGATGDYTISVADDVTSLDFTPTYDSSTGMSISKLNGSAYTCASGNKINVTKSAITANGGKVAITTKAQDGTEKTYTITVKLLSTDTSITSSDSIKIISSIDSTIVYNGTISGNTVTFANDLPYSNTSKQVTDGYYVLATVASTASAKKTLSLYSTATTSFQATLASGTKSNKVLFVANNKDRQLKTIILRVTAEAGNTEDYVLNVYRAKADNDKALDNTAFMIEDQDHSNITSNGSWTGNAFSFGSYQLPYAPTSGVNPGVYFKVKFPAKSTATYKTSSATSPKTLTSETLSGKCEFASGNNSLVITITVTSEYGEPTDYTITVNRASASTDNSLTAAVKDNKNNPIPDTNGNWDSASNPTWTMLDSNKIPRDTTNGGITFAATFDSTATAQISTDGVSYVSYTSGDEKTYKFGNNTQLTVYVKVRSQSGDEKTYKYIYKMEGPSTDNTISNIGFWDNKDNSIDPTSKGGWNADKTAWVMGDAYKLPYDTTNTGVKVAVDIPSTATAQIRKGSGSWETYPSGTKKVYTFGTATSMNIELLVKAESNDQKTYTFTFKMEGPSSDTTATNFIFRDNAGTNIPLTNGVWSNSDTIWTMDDSFKLPYDVTATGVSVSAKLPSTATAQIRKGNGTWENYTSESFKAYTFGTDTSMNIELKVIPQSGVADQKTYTFTFKMQEPNNDTAHTLTVQVGSKTYTFLKNDTTKLWTNTADPLPYGTTSATFTLDSTIATTSIKRIVGSTESDVKGTAHNVTISDTARTFGYRICTQASPTTGVIYNVIVSIASPDDTHGSTETVVVTVNGVDYPCTLNGNIWQTSPSNPLPYPTSTDTVSYKITTSQGTNIIKDTSGGNITGQVKTFPNYKGTNPTVDFKVCTVANTSGHPYQILVNTQSPDDDASVATVTVEGWNDGHDYGSGSYDSDSKTYTYIMDKTAAGYAKFVAFQPTKTTSTVEWATKLNDLGTPNATKFSPNSQFEIGTNSAPKTYYFKVTAQDGKATNSYIVILKDQDRRSTDNRILSIEIPEIADIKTDFDSSTYTYRSQTNPYEIPYNVEEINIDKVSLPTGATLSTDHTQAGVTIKFKENETKGIQFQAISESGLAGQTYTIYVKRKSGSAANDLLKLKINGVDIDLATPAVPGKLIYDYCLPIANRNDLSARIYLEWSTAAKIETLVSTDEASETSIVPATSLTLQPINLEGPGKVTQLTVTVLSEKNVFNGTKGKEYQFFIYNAEQGFNVSDVDFLTSSTGTTAITDVNGNVFTFDPSSNAVQTFKVPYTTEKAYAKVTMANDSLFANITSPVANPMLVDLSNTGDTNPNQLVVEVKSEYAQLNSRVKDQSKRYVINIVRAEADTENRIDKLVVTIDGTVQTFDNGVVAHPDTPAYSISNVTGTQVTLDFEKLSKVSTISIDGYTDPIDQSLTSYTLTLPISVSSTSNTDQKIKITCTSESNVPNVYIITLAAKQYVPDTNNSITKIEVVADNDAVTNLLTPGYAETIHQYTVTVRADVNKVVVSASKFSNTATLTINGDQTGSKTIDLSTYTSPITVPVQCTSESGVAGTKYEIVITKLDADSDTSLKSFKINDSEELSKANTPNAIYLTNSTTSIKVFAEPTSQYAKINGQANYSDNAYTVSVGANNIQVTVVAENGDTQIHTLVVYVDEVTSLDDLHANDAKGNDYVQGFDPAILNYGSSSDPIILPYEVKTLDISYTASAQKLSEVTIAGIGTQPATGELPAGTVYDLKVTVLARSGANTVYHIWVQRTAGSDDNFIKSFTDENGVTTENFEHVNVNNTPWVYVVPRRIDTWAPSFTLSDPTNATHNFDSIRDKTLSYGRNQFAITVTSQTGKKNVYNFEIYRADTNFDLTDIAILDSKNGTDVQDKDDQHIVDYQPADFNYVLNVNYKQEKVWLKVVKDSDYAKILVNNNAVNIINSSNPNEYLVELTLAEGDNIYTIQGESECANYFKGKPEYADHVSDVYTIKIVRAKAKTNAKLESLVVKDSSGNILPMTPAFDPDNVPNPTYIIENAGSITVVAIAAKAYESSTDVTGDVGTGINLPALSDPSNTNVNYRFEKKIITKAEDGTSYTYTIIISRGPVDLNSDNEVSFYEIEGVVDGVTKKYFDRASFDPTTKEYNVTIPYGPQSIIINGEKASTYSPMIFVGTGTHAIQKEWYGTTQPFVVYSKAQNGADGEKYTFHVLFEAPDGDNTLKDLKIEGTTIDGFDPNITDYDLGTVPYTTVSLDVAATPNSQLAKIMSQLGTKQLPVGTKTISITCQAQDGTSKTYNVTVKRDLPDAYLIDLSVDGHSLLDANGDEVKFDKDLKEYHLTIPNSESSINISVVVPSVNYTTSCTNGPTLTGLDGRINRTFDAISVPEGTNDYTITATSPEGKKVEYVLKITRRTAKESDATLKSITMQLFDKKDKEVKLPEVDLEKDYNENKNQIAFEYNIPNKVRYAKIDPKTTFKGATYQVINADNLKPGNNYVVVVVTAQDKMTSRAIVINLVRDEMEFEVKLPTDLNYKFEAVDSDKLVYRLDLVDQPASIIPDFTKFIASEDIENLDVKVLTSEESLKNPNCREVLLEVSDGQDKRIVTIEVDTTAGTGDNGPMNWVPFIGLGLAIILLIIILICVNRDKYGSINKKRKKDTE